MILKAAGCAIGRFALPCRVRLPTLPSRCMATARSHLSHEERTASSPRQNKSHTVKLANITQLSSSIRIVHLKPADEKTPISFLPGQWLDVHIPGIPKAGGFTITSAPAQSELQLELAVQRSPKNPPAAWLWRPASEILNTELSVMVGGAFTWPPTTTDGEKKPVDSVLMVAGGVGINPLISMMRHIYGAADKGSNPKHLTIYYATKAGLEPDGSDVLFLTQLREMAADFSSKAGCTFNIQLFVTFPSDSAEETRWDSSLVKLPVLHRRLEANDIVHALSVGHRQSETICYVCGPKAFADRFVDVAKQVKGMSEDRVLCEKWW